MVQKVETIKVVRPHILENLCLRKVDPKIVTDERKEARLRVHRPDSESPDEEARHNSESSGRSDVARSPNPPGSLERHYQPCGWDFSHSATRPIVCSSVR